MISDDRYSIHDVNFFNDNILQVFYSKNVENDITDTSITHAAFVTAYGRLSLYQELKKLNKRVLYYDTDSIIYISKPNEYDIKLGDYLGEWSSELAEDEYIEEFISAGPKNYAYRTNIGREQCVVKGFFLNYATGLKINFDSIKNIVISDHNAKIEIDDTKFKRDKSTWNVSCITTKKLYGFVYDKRVLMSNLISYPFGHENITCY